MDNVNWQSPPETLACTNYDIHIWRTQIDQPTEFVRALAPLLSADEQGRAERFYFEQDRTAFIVSRGILRIILGRYLEIDPKQIQLSYNPYGKPEIRSGDGKHAIHFSVAHSHQLALYAITREQEIGIDVELVHPIDDADQIIARFFSIEEAAKFSALSDQAKPQAFFASWTRKEAYLKARGWGLNAPLNQIADNWAILPLSPAPNYVGAVAVKQNDWTLNYWNVEFPAVLNKFSLTPR